MVSAVLAERSAWVNTFTTESRNDMVDDSSLVGIGRIAGAYGIKGWVKIVSFTEPPENMFAYQPWQRRDRAGRNGPQDIVIEQWKAHGKNWVAQVAGVTDRDAAEALQGQELVVTRAVFPEPAGGTYYWADLEGMRVITQEGRELGTVDHLLETGTVDVMVVLDEASRYLVPFMQGSTVVNVDLPERCITVDWQPE